MTSETNDKQATAGQTAGDKPKERVSVGRAQTRSGASRVPRQKAAAHEAPRRLRNAGHRAKAPRRAGNAAAHGATGTNVAPDQAAKQGKPRKQNFIARAINGWCNRLLGAVTEGELSDQPAEYASHRTTRDYICNSIGTGAWGMVFPVLTVVVTQLVGVELAGMFSLAFVTGSLLMILANYGVRTFQISDLAEAHSFSDYQVNRWITCAIMLVVGWIYCSIRGYADEMFVISMGVYVYKMVDGLADVYEGRLQQKDKLYLAGISQAFRSVVVLVVFSVALFITRSVGVSCIAMAVAACATFVVLTLPLAIWETPKSERATTQSVVALFKQCAPLFVALFLYSLIDNMPKFVMEGVLSYDNQLYYNALYFPAMGILLTAQLIYKPMLVKMAAVWADPDKRKRFDLIIVVMIAVIIGITAVVALVMGWIGITVMSFLYGVDFEQFRGLCFIMLAAGGVTACIDFLYQVVTVLRQQKTVTKLYLITFGFSLFVPTLLVNFTGLPGSVIGYLIVMMILLVLLVWEYGKVRIALGERDKRAAAAEAERVVAHAVSDSTLGFDPAPAARSPRGRDGAQGKGRRR